MNERAMTDTEKKMAKGLQRLAEDELGKRPKLTVCQRIIREMGPPDPAISREQRISALFVQYEERLRGSAKVAGQPEGLEDG